MMQRVRVAVVNSHPIQYFAPLYAYLNRDPALEVTALYCSDFSLRDGIDPGFKRTVTWDVDLLQGYPHVFVGSNNDRGSSPWFLVANVPTDMVGDPQWEVRRRLASWLQLRRQHHRLCRRAVEAVCRF